MELELNHVKTKLNIIISKYIALLRPRVTKFTKNLKICTYLHNSGASALACQRSSIAKEIW